MATLPEDIAPCYTVEDLIKALQELPPDLEIRVGFEYGVKPMIFNASSDPFLDLQENEDDFDGEGEDW